MSLGHGAKIVKDGLAFAYDMGSRQSWKGKPTTNLKDVSLVGLSGVSLSLVENVGGWKKYSMSGTFSSGSYPYCMFISSQSFTGGTAYSSQCIIKTNVLHKFNYFGSALNYVNEPQSNGGSLSITTLEDGSKLLKREGFIYISTTTQAGYLGTNPINNTTFDPATDFVWLKDGQIEQNSFSTPFAGPAGTRSNTEAIIDWKGGNTITASSLTYNTDGSFAFNGTSDFLSLTPDMGYNSNFSQFAWFKSNGTPAGGYHIIFGGSEAEVSIPTAGALRVGVTTPTRYVGNLGSGLSDGNWHYIGMTYNPSESVIRGYIDGEPVGTIDTDGGNPTASFTRTIGKFGTSGTYYANGEISNVSIYNKALLAAEVKSNFNALRGRFGI